jgi:ABC-2 type transport system permease protein
MTRASVALARRALRNYLRRPQFLAPLVAFPSLFLAINVGGLSGTTQLPGFPKVNGFLDFQLAGAMLQSLLLGGVSGGIVTALDIEGGFFDRLVASPIPRSSIVMGRVLAGGVLSLIQVTYFLALGWAFGAHVEGGVAGVLAVLALGVVAGTGFTAIGITLALRARNASTVQGIFPLVFVVLFISSAFFPRDLLEAPVDVLADYNPLSYIADGMRDPVISHLSVAPFVEGMLAAAGVTAAFVAFAIVSLRGRLRDA